MGKKDFSMTITYQDGELSTQSTYEDGGHFDYLVNATAAIIAINAIAMEREALEDPTQKPAPREITAATCCAATEIAIMAQERGITLLQAAQGFIEEA